MVDNSSLGLVGTRGRIPKTILNSGPFTINEQTYHFARDTVAAVWVAWANWWAQDSGAGESNAGAAMTGFRCSAATSTSGPWAQGFQASGPGDTSQVTSTWTVADGTTTWANIPISLQRGQLFFVRSLRTTNFFAMTTGANYSAVFQDISGGDQAAISATDFTTGGSFSDGGLGNYFGPIALVGYTNRPNFACVGDSIMMGDGDTVETGAGDSGVAARSLAPNFAYTNLGVFGEASSQFTASACPKRFAIARLSSHIMNNYGINDDISVGAAAAIANLQSFWGRFPGQKIWQTTLLPVSNSTDGWATTANQTAIHTDRVTVNAFLRGSGSQSGTIGLVDVAPAVETALNSGIWTAPGKTGDGIHPTQSGYRDIASGGSFSQISQYDIFGPPMRVRMV